MNSWKLNGMAGHLTRQAIIRGLNIPCTQIYKVVKSVSADGLIETHEGKKYKLTLEEIKDESRIDSSIK
jgi:sugar-specific transcriptional regulator TrmB